MWKIFGVSLGAILIFVFAGWVINGSGFDFGAIALFSVGFSLMGYAFISHAKWCDDKNYSDRVLSDLNSDRAYLIMGRGKVGTSSVSFLYDTTAKKTVVYSGPLVPRGFFETKKGEKTYLVASGKLLVEGKVGDCVFAPTK